MPALTERRSLSQVSGAALFLIAMKEIPAHEFNAVTPERLQEILAGPPEEAARWLYTAAEHGVAEAQTHYGQWLLDGRGVAVDARQALEWFRLAANQGHAMGMNMLGRCYENGWGVAQDVLLATYWFKFAAQAGLDWGMYNYATSLALGRGTEQDRPEALQWLLKATALGHIKSWNLLGGFHEDGWTGTVDIDAALDCYRKAADGGDFRGQFNYGRVLAEQGKQAEGMAWIQRAHDNPTATSAFREKLLHFLQQA